MRKFKKIIFILALVMFILCSCFRIDKFEEVSIHAENGKTAAEHDRVKHTFFKQEEENA